MEKIHKFVIGIVIIAIVLSILLSPAITILAGFALWIILWLAQGGMAEGNPYKRMRYSSIPDFIEVKDYKIKEDIEIRDRGSYQTTIFVFGVGGLLVIIGVIWIWIFGF